MGIVLQPIGRQFKSSWRVVFGAVSRQLRQTYFPPRKTFTEMISKISFTGRLKVWGLGSKTKKKQGMGGGGTRRILQVDDPMEGKQICMCLTA